MAVVVQNFLDKNGLATVAECVKKLIASSGSGGGASSGGALRLNAKFMIDITEDSYQMTKEDGLIYCTNLSAAVQPSLALILPAVDESDKGLCFIIHVGNMLGQTVYIAVPSSYTIIDPANANLNHIQVPSDNLTFMMAYKGDKQWALVPLYSS